MQASKITYLGARYNDVEAVMFEAFMGLTLQHFTEKAETLQRINVDVSEGEAAVGETVTIPLPIDFGEAKSLAKGEKTTPQGITQETAQVVIDTDLYVEFAISDREFSTALLDGVPHRAMTAAADALARGINQRVRDLALQITTTSGTGGETYSRKSVIKAGSALDLRDVPDEDRFLAMGPVMSEEVLDENMSGDKADKWFKSGKVSGPLLGFDAYKDKGIKFNYIEGGA